MSLTVLEPGPLTLPVDLGRPKHRALGVPLGGAADRAALRLGNGIVGNDAGVAALEFALAGPTLRSSAALGCVVYGAPFEVQVGQRRIRPGTSFNVKPGEVIRIGATPLGCRGYLCVTGGLQTPEILGSRTALDPVRKGDVLRCPAGAVRPRSLAEPLVRYQPTDRTVTLRALPGGQADWFDLAEFFAATFVVSPASNRMGLRLDGAILPRPEREMVSEPVAPGTVQVVNDGRCIVLGVDGQTIGGYPKVAHVIAADWDAMGQLRPGQRLRFEQVSLDEAERAFHEQEMRIRSLLLRLRVA